MSITFMEVCNEVLADLNEVPLTSSTFTSAVSIQRHVKNVVNKAYLDLNNPEFKWPWLSVAAPTDGYFGNTYIETVPGQQWYLLKGASADFNSDHGHVNWKSFTLTTEGVAGEVAPYTIKKLRYTPRDEWYEQYSVSEARSLAESQDTQIPCRVVPSPDGRRFGLSPVPSAVYRIYFYAWRRPERMSNYNDPVEIPDQFVSVLVSRARYYAWQRKENAEQAMIADQEYTQGLDGMVEQTINSAPDHFKDTRTVY